MKDKSETILKLKEELAQTNGNEEQTNICQGNKQLEK